MASDAEQFERFSAEPPPPSPRRRAPLVWIIVLVVGLLAALPLCCCGGFFWFTFQALANSEPYRIAFERVSQDPGVRDHLGEPIERRGLVQGNVSIRNDQGDASLRFTIYGPKGQADVQTSAVRTGGRWVQRELRVRYPDGEQVIILGGGDRVELPGEVPVEADDE